jgi:TatD DNase family protein
MFDCHTHVQFEAFKSDWKEVIERAQSAGVSMINVGTQKDTSQAAVDMAHRYEQGVYAAIGLHPVHTTESFHDEAELGGGPAAKAFTSRGEEFDYDFYLNLARDSKVVALGECGLDYYRVIANDANSGGNNANEDWKEKQKEVFLQHVKIAQETGKALMIHCRPSKGTDDAYEDLLALLMANSEWHSVPKVLHFYVGSVAMTQKFLDDGFNFEFGGVITFTKSYIEQIKMIPLDRITLETDSPYVSPEPYRGQRNEPAYVVEVAKKLAEIKGISYDEVVRVTDENVKRIFRL